MEKNILITGGAGFIGSHLVRLLVSRYPQYRIVNFDCLTYAGNLENLTDLEDAPNYTFVKGDICDAAHVAAVMTEYAVTHIIHLAAESHVDRSILNPIEFVRTNVVGTATLLNAAVAAWKGNFKDRLFYHVSTDEVFGSLGPEGKFSEKTPYDPHSPYSASKASSDHFVRAYHDTYGLPVVISNCSNNFGSHQFPEKLLPLMIRNIREGKPLPVYGKGENIRDWLWVNDHVEAMDLILHKGTVGETYCIGGNNEWRNIDLVHLLCSIMDEQLGRQEGTAAGLITFVTDRPGHDQRYAIDASHIMRELGWAPTPDFRKALTDTVKWYLANDAWVARVTSGEYQHYYEQQYAGR
jgi:dTDP-glucose 4,6-dehydratase